MGNFVRRIPVGAAVAVTVLVVEAGCAAFQEVPTPDTAYQPSVGTVAVVASDRVPQIELEGYAHGKGEGAARGAGGTYGGCVRESLMSGNGLGLLVGVFVCPFVAAGGAVAGAVNAPSADEVAAAEHALMTPSNDRRIQGALRSQVLLADVPTGPPLVLLPEQLEKPGGGKPDYHALVAAHIDSVLEVELTRVGTKVRGGAGTNPPLILFMQAHAQLVRTRDGARLYSADYVYGQAGPDILGWSANDARKFRAALENGYRALGTRIYDDVFLLYPFPRRGYNTKVPSTFGLAPVSPPWRRWSKVDSLEPTLRWQAFPRQEDLLYGAQQEMDHIRHVRYDLIVARAEDGLPAGVVYSRTGLTTTEHTLETPLAPHAQYLWTVRARFMLDGRERVTEWGSQRLPFKEMHPCAPSAFSYRFRTPEVKPKDRKEPKPYPRVPPPGWSPDR